MSACYSLCGSWVTLQDQRGKLQCEPWIVPPECLGRVAPYRLPRTIQPKHATTSMLWGDHTVSLHSVSEGRRFSLTIRDRKTSASILLIDQLLPNYLFDITPAVILDNEESPSIRLIFQCRDRAPEVMVLSETWNSLQREWQKISERYNARLAEKIGQDLSNERLDSYHDILALHGRYDQVFKKPFGTR